MNLCHVQPARTMAVMQPQRFQGQWIVCERWKRALNEGWHSAGLTWYNAWPCPLFSFLFFFFLDFVASKPRLLLCSSVSRFSFERVLFSLFGLYIVALSLCYPREKYCYIYIYIYISFRTPLLFPHSPSLSHCLTFLPSDGRYLVGSRRASTRGLYKRDPGLVRRWEWGLGLGRRHYQRLDRGWCQNRVPGRWRRVQGKR